MKRSGSLKHFWVDRPAKNHVAWIIGALKPTAVEIGFHGTGRAAGKQKGQEIFGSCFLTGEQGFGDTRIADFKVLAWAVIELGVDEPVADPARSLGVAMPVVD